MVLNTIWLTTSHTSENFATIMKEITDHWDITKKVHLCIFDSASYIKRAIWLVQWIHLTCLAHTINLIMVALISCDQEVVASLEQMKKIVGFSHHSSKAMDSLCLNLPDHKLIQQVDTRWNSTYYMLKRYLEQHEAIKTAMYLFDRNDLLIPMAEHTATLREVVKILAPFKAITQEI